ncbi:sodium:solute symporter family protein [Bacillus tianshenii]|nr:sodium:solute symporter family protein [Bacillus tianshenii]
MYDSIVYLLYFLIYSVFILIFGKHGFDKTDTLKGYFVANRNLSVVSGFASFTATWFSAASFFGLPALIYAEGFRVVWITTAAWVFGGVVILLIAQRLNGFDIITIPEFFYVRYHSRYMQIVVSVILIIVYLLYIVIQFRGFGIVIGAMLDIPYFLSVLLVYLFVLYTTFGGLYSVARSDIFHFILLLTGAVVGVLLIGKHTGGLDGMMAELSHLQSGGIVQEEYTSFFEGVSFWTVLSAFLSLGLGVAVNPQYGIRILAAKSKQTAFRMVLLSIFFIIIIYACIFIIGVGARTLYPVHIGNYEEVIPYIITHIFDSPWKGFLLISIVAASISTANSQLLMIASSLVYDIGGSKRRNQHPERTIAISRIVIVLFASLAVLLSYLAPSGLVYFSGQLWGGIASTMVFPLLGGLFGRGVSKQGASWSMIAGALTYVISLAVIPAPAQEVFHPVLPGLFVSGFIYFLHFFKKGAHA